MEFLRLGQPDETFTVKDSELPGVERGASGVSYTLRPLSTARYFEMVDGLSEKKWDRRLNRMEKIAPTPEVIHAAAFEYVLMDWSGVHDFHGQPLPCSDGNKRLLDAVRQRGIVEVASANRVSSAPDDSFRPSPRATDVVD